MKKPSPPYADHHVHTKYSRCSHGSHDLKDIIAFAESRGFSYVCVSDHIHYDFDDKYFPEHSQIALMHRQTPNALPLFLGAEFTILNAEGKMPKQSFSQDRLNYFLVGEHYIPGTPITMDDLPFSRSVLKQYFYETPEKLENIAKILKNMYINCMVQSRPTILVHPFSTLLRCDFTSTILYDVFENVCEVAQNSNTAIELNSSQLMSCFQNPTPIIIDDPNCPSKDVFLTEILRILRKYDVKISMGSDAHLLSEIGEFAKQTELIERFKFPKARILNLLTNIR